MKLKSDEKLRRLSVSLKADIETQYTPRQSRDVTYISRLQVTTYYRHWKFESCECCVHKIEVMISVTPFLHS